MGLVEPLPPHPAAVVDGPERMLLIADFHAGFEAALRYEEGIELESRAPDRRDLLLELLEEASAERLVVLGDLTHSIGEPGGAERAELEVLFEALDVPVTVAKGNHDGVIEEFVETDPDHFGRVSITATAGGRIGELGVAHGHTWPNTEALSGDVLCIGHEHPAIRLVDEVGGRRIERAWLRGRLDPAVFPETPADPANELVVVPAFNELCGGTWVNEPTQGFLSPFLPEALDEGRIYLLDGTDLGTVPVAGT